MLEKELFLCGKVGKKAILPLALAIDEDFQVGQSYTVQHHLRAGDVRACGRSFHVLHWMELLELLHGKNLHKQKLRWSSMDELTKLRCCGNTSHPWQHLLIVHLQKDPILTTEVREDRWCFCINSTNDLQRVCSCAWNNNSNHFEILIQLCVTQFFYKIKHKAGNLEIDQALPEIMGARPEATDRKRVFRSSCSVQCVRMTQHSTQDVRPIFNAIFLKVPAKQSIDCKAMKRKQPELDLKQKRCSQCSMVVFDESFEINVMTTCS